MKSSKPLATTSKSIMTENELFVPSSQPWKPHAGQRKGIKFLLEHACAGLFADPGVGKTSIVYGALKILKKKGLVKKVLVVAPLRPCYLVWPKEQIKWTDFKDFKVEILHGPKKQEALDRDADIYVINPEGLDWLLGAERTKSKTGKISVQVDLRQFKELGFDTLVVDELSKFKHPSSGRHKALKAVLGTFARRWGLTGSPAPNGLEDLFGQCYILDQGRTFGQYITHFRSNYFVPAFSGFGWTVRRNAEKEIYDRLAPLVLRLDANDYIDMPELVINKIEFELPTEVRKIYDALENDMLAKFDENIVTAVHAGAASVKCRQVANGGLYLEPDLEKILTGTAVFSKRRDWANLHEIKVDLVEDLANELQGSPLLVAYDFQHDLDRLLKRFGKNTPYIGGGVSAARALELEKEWNRGNLPILLGHPMSIGHGLNLQEAGNHVCWHSMTYDFELYDQFIGRIRRQGQKNRRVFVHHILAKNTVDETIFWTLTSKNRTQRALLDALKNTRCSRK